MADGDVAGLVAAIRAANADRQADTILLAPQGSYTVSATATDQAGNTGTGSATLVVDTTNPAVTVNPLTTNSASPALSGTVSDNGGGDTITGVQVTVNGTNQSENRVYAEKLRDQLAKIGSLRDLQYEQALAAYPTIDVRVDRAKAGLSGVTTDDVGRALPPATLSSPTSQCA